MLRTASVRFHPVIALPEAWLAGRIRVEASANITGNLASPCNFARFFLPKLLPGVRRVLYLDADVVVQADVASLFELALPAGALAAAVPRSEPHFRYKRYAARAGETFAKRYRARQVRLDGTKPTFNAGVMLADLDAWRAAALTEDAVWWLEQHAASPDGLWHLGSQPPMHLILYGRWAPLPPRCCVRCVSQRRARRSSWWTSSAARPSTSPSKSDVRNACWCWPRRARTFAARTARARWPSTRCRRGSANKLSS